MKEIKFTTKFEPGNEVAYLDTENMKIKVSEIEKIQFEISNEGTDIWYKLSNRDYIRENKAFASRQEIIDNL